MTSTTQTEIAALHSVYCSASGMTDVSLSMERIYAWERWLTHRGHEPWSERDLADVIAYIRRKIKTGERRIASLQFRTLIWDCERFEEDLAAAHATMRNTVVRTPRDKVLAATGRTTRTNEREAQPVSAVLESTKLAEMLRAWKETNPL